MYLLESGTQPKPGTDLIERYTGMGQYVKTQRYLFTPAAAAGIRGLGCRNCRGVGSFMDGSGLLGTGLFVNGMDPSTWGVGEYAVLGVGVFALFSMFDTGRRGVTTARRKGRAVRKALAA